MMKRFFVILISCLWLAVPLFAQSNKLIRELESKRGALQKQIAESESILKDTKKDVGSQLNSLAVLTGQIEERKRYIMAINNDVEAIQRELASLERQLHGLEKDLKDKKKKYEASVQYLYKNKSIEEKLMFIFSAKNLGQTYRRMRYVREYATYQRLQGEEILKKQEQIRKKKAERQQVKAAKEGLLKERREDGLVIESPGLVHPLKVDADASVVDNVPVYVALRPEKIMLCEAPPPEGYNFAVGEVVHIAYLGDLSVYHVRLKSGQMLSAQLQNEHRYRKGLPTWGDEVRLCWDADSCVVLTV